MTKKMATKIELIGIRKCGLLAELNENESVPAGAPGIRALYFAAIEVGHRGAEFRRNCSARNIRGCGLPVRYDTFMRRSRTRSQPAGRALCGMSDGRVARVTRHTRGHPIT